jgi:hypothetical protein
VLAPGTILEKGRVPVPDQSGLAGQTIAAYTLVSLIGEGGMGSVWLAERSDGQTPGYFGAVLWRSERKRHVSVTALADDLRR